jgi:hypothetical protein
MRARSTFILFYNNPRFVVAPLVTTVAVEREYPSWTLLAVQAIVDHQSNPCFQPPTEDVRLGDLSVETTPQSHPQLLELCSADAVYRAS